MLPLIVPPIVLVLCLGFLVWFLSRKSADPALQEHLATLDVSSRPRRWLFVFPQALVLRLLERMLQKLKLISLKFHNRFQEFLNFLRQKREAALEAAEPAVTDDGERGVAASEDKEHFWDRWHRRHRATPEVAGAASGAVLQEADAAYPAKVAVTVMDPVLPLSKPDSRLGNLKKKVASLTQGETPSYFTRKKSAVLPPRKLLSEEELIDRIAKNPKDAASYEDLGDYYLSGGNLADAKACYRQVIKLSPLNREVKDKVRKLERLLVQRERHKG